MSGHSETPWTLGDIIRGERHISADDANIPWYGFARVVVEVGNELCPTGEANARRIVAAVNGTANLSTEALEAGVVDKLVEALAEAEEYDALALQCPPSVQQKIRTALATIKGEKA